MKTKLPVLLLLCLASCSHTPPAAYESAPVVAQAEPAKPPVEPPPAAPVVVAPETNLPPARVPELNLPPEAPAPPAVAAASTNAPSPFVRPQPPSVPALPGGPPSAPGHPASASAVSREEMISAGLVDFRGADLNSVLQLYCQMINRTLLRPQALPDVKIFLKNQTELTKAEMLQAFDAVLALNGISMVRIGDKFVKAVPSAQVQQEGAPINALNDPDALPDVGQYITHVVQLKYIKTTEAVPALTPFAKLPNSIVPIESSQILVLRDYTENVKRMLEMINKIDVVVAPDFTSEVIPIKYALASDISSALNSLSTGGSGATVGSSGAARSGGIGGGGIGGNRTGAGAAGGYGQPGGTTYPGGVNRGGINPTAGGINPGAAATPGGSTFTDRLRGIIQRASGSGQGEIQVLGQTKIIADERTNSLLVYASRADMETIKDIVSKLDVVLAQVLIEAIIMEVSIDNKENLGVSMAQSRNGTSALGGYNNGQPFFPFGSLGASNSFPGNFSSTLPANQFTYWGRFGLNGNNFDVALQALSSDGRVNVLSRPRVQTSHGVEADLFVGQTVPYITGTTYGDFAGVSSRSQYEEKQIGITLQVKPLINPDGLVVMEIYSEIGQPGATPVVIDGNPVPIINQRQAKATVAVKDRDTIILGGMIGTTKNKTRSGVPYLKDMPLLGPLFRSNSDSEQRTELIVLLRPTVLPTPEAAALVADTERKRLPGVRRAEAEMREEETQRLKQAAKDLDHPAAPKRTLE